ncbi:MAG: VPLPA-CTERM sorting domain-containing protein [Methylococcales bacterium]
MRSQISGTIQFDTATGSGSATVNPFEFFHGSRLVTSNFELQAIGNSLIIGNMNMSWLWSDFTSQVVWDASGLFSELATVAYGDVYDASTCKASGACATPASDQIEKGRYPIGPTPIVTTSFNTVGQTGIGTTIGQLSLGTDDGIGGSPIYSPPNYTFTGFNPNFDITTITITSGPHPPIPVPAAVWLFGSGLLGLTTLARRKKTR